MVAQLIKTQTRPRSGQARKTTRSRRLLDLRGRELYAVMSYRLAMAVLGLIALIYVTGH